MNALAVSVATVVATFFSREFGTGISRAFILCVPPIAFCGLLVSRAAGYILMLGFRLKRPHARIALVGNLPQARTFLSTLPASTARHLCGVVVPPSSLDKSDTPLETVQGVPILGTTTHLAELVNRNQIRHAIVLDRSLLDSEIDHCNRVLWRMGVPVSYELGLPLGVSIIGNVQSSVPRLEISRRHGLPTVEIRSVASARHQDALKRAFDVACASVLLGLFSPVLVGAVLFFRSLSKEPVLERRLHSGKGGRYFHSVRFRRSAHGDSAGVASVRKWLVRHRLDELPEFLNVLRGRMSIVGPTPLPVEIVAEQQAARPEQAELLKQRGYVKPGLTGLWQVSSRALSFQEMLELDVKYVQTHSFALDFYILLGTPGPFLRGVRPPCFEAPVRPVFGEAS